MSRTRLDGWSLDEWGQLRGPDGSSVQIERDQSDGAESYFVSACGPDRATLGQARADEARFVALLAYPGDPERDRLELGFAHTFLDGLGVPKEGPPGEGRLALGDRLQAMLCDRGARVRAAELAAAQPPPALASVPLRALLAPLVESRARKGHGCWIWFARSLGVGKAAVWLWMEREGCIPGDLVEDACDVLDAPPEVRAELRRRARRSVRGVTR